MSRSRKSQAIVGLAAFVIALAPFGSRPSAARQLVVKLVELDGG